MSAIIDSVFNLSDDILKCQINKTEYDFIISIRKRYYNNPEFQISERQLQFLLDIHKKYYKQEVTNDK